MLYWHDPAVLPTDKVFRDYYNAEDYWSDVRNLQYAWTRARILSKLRYNATEHTFGLPTLVWNFFQTQCIKGYTYWCFFLISWQVEHRLHGHTILYKVSCKLVWLTGIGCWFLNINMFTFIKNMLMNPSVDFFFCSWRYNHIYSMGKLAT